MKKLVVMLLALASFGNIQAQEQKWLDLRGEVRIDYQRDYIDGSAEKSNTGFKGQYINIILTGDISESFSFAYRQRLNKAHSDQTFFDATDWLYLTYKANENWSISGGKLVVGIGGYEYDRAPIDLYYCSEFWNHIPCYQFGVNLIYTTNSGKDKFIAQFCESPFNIKDEEMYAYNLMWYGQHGWFNTIYSANAIEYQPGEFIYYLALGNEFKLSKKVTLHLDYLNRSTNKHAFLFKDCSVIGELSYLISPKVNVYGKVSYDVNRTGFEGDYCVYSGTELTRVGGGIEYYPLREGNRNLRLHANVAYSWGSNGNENGVMQPLQTIMNVGVKWAVDILSLTKKKKK